MIISRTCTRLSLAGGSTDVKEFYQEYGSLVLAASLAKYIYISVRTTPKIFNYRSSVQYSQLEHVDDNSLISHEGCRGTLAYLGIKFGIEVQNLLDLPARSGLGSSSAYVIGLLNACHTLLGHDNITKRQLADEAIEIERGEQHLNQSGGIQDQIASAFGGLNSIEIAKDGTYKVKPLPVTQEFIQLLNESMVLFYVGQRDSFGIARSHNTPSATKYKLRIQSIAHEMLKAFNDENIDEIGKLTEASWQEKRQTSPLISNQKIDDLHNHMLHHGAIGARLLGSGGSGFILAITNNRHKLLQNIDLHNIDFTFDYTGSKIILS